jgi:thiol:disulfide interchange protein DsbC
MIRTSLLTIALLSSLGTFSAQADEITDAIQDNLKKSNPNLKIKSIQPAQIPGLYEVFTNGIILYVDKGANYVLAGGTLYENSTKRNLTDERMRSLTAIKFDSLPFKDAIEFKKGTGNYKFAVFTDPDCPSCQKMEQGLEKFGITDYTAYIFLMPLEEIHKEARWKAEAIWCASDRSAAWKAWMVEGKLPEKATCQNPIDNVKKLSEELGVAGTPTIYFADGNMTNNPQELVQAIGKK